LGTIKTHIRDEATAYFLTVELSPTWLCAD